MLRAASLLLPADWQYLTAVSFQKLGLFTIKKYTPIIAMNAG